MNGCRCTFICRPPEPRLWPWLTGFLSVAVIAAALLGFI